MADMIKFFKGLEASLPASGVNGALYITTDEGGIYLGTGTGMKRLGDFVQVDAVANLPAKAHEGCLYYCVAENVLAKWNGTEWKQINKQPTAAELKTLLGLGSLAYKSEVAEGDLNANLKAKVNAASEGNHSHDNKALLDTYTQTEVDLADAVAKKHAHTFVESELNKIADGDVAKWNAAEGNAKSYADEKIAALDFTDTAVAGEYVSAVNEVDGKISVTRVALPDYTNTYDAKGAAATAESNAKSYADGLAANYDEKGAAAGVKTELETEIAKKVDKVEGKSLIADSEITRLASVTNYDDTQVKADIAKKADAETMTTELGKKVDKVDGYSLVSDTEIARLADVSNYDDTVLAGKVSTAEGKITALETESAKHALKTEVEAVDAKFADYTKTADLPTDLGDFTNEAGYAKTADVNTELANKADKTQVATDIANAIAPLATTEALNGVKVTAEAATTVEEVDAQIDAKITALNFGTTYEPIGAEDRAKAYVDGKFTDANLSQYTTEQEVKDIVDGVIAGAADSETYNSLTKLVDYIDTHGGEASEMAQAIDALEGKVDTIEKKPAYDITATQISSWDNEVGAKDLAETKTTTAEVKDQIEAYGYATTGYADGKASDAQSAAEATAAGALASAKSELEGKITDGNAATLAAAKEDAAAKVKALEDGAVATNAANIATKANAADVYTKTEVEALLTWGSF